VNLCRHSPAKIWLGFTVLLSAHHFVLYSKVVIKHLEEEAELCERRLAVAATTNDFVGVEAVS